MKGTRRKLLCFFNLLFASIVLLPLSGYSADITIKPGRFDHFKIFIPDRIVAGEEANIKLAAVDAYDNLITESGEVEKEFQISISGSAIVKPAFFNFSSFVNGTRDISLVDKAAEVVEITIGEITAQGQVQRKKISIIPNKLHSFLIKVPSFIQAGETIQVEIIAKDAFGNTVEEPIKGEELTLAFKGDVEPKIISPIPNLKNGVGVANLVARKTGTFTIEAKYTGTGSTGASDKIKIVNAPASAFKINAPAEVIAGEPFNVSIVAIDHFDNVAANYAVTGSHVAITSTGKSKPFPSLIPNYKFMDGHANIELTYDRAEEISLTAVNEDKKCKGYSDVIKVVNPIPARFEIKTPESAVAGQKFKIKITVYNQKGNIFENYNILGPDVHLTTTGTGTLIPETIPATEFSGGTASVEIQYTKAEAFTILASPGRINLSKHSTVSKPQQEIVQEAEVEKKQAEVEEKSKIEIKKKKVEDIKKSQAEIKKTAKVNEKSNEEKTQAITSPEPVAASFRITGVSINELTGKTIVAIQIPNIDRTVKYKISTEKIGDEDWIFLTVKNVYSEIEKNTSSKSPLVGDILIENDSKKETAVVKIKQLKPSAFYVIREKGSLKVVLKHK
ncbi:MAG: hypothetical protein AB1610_00890 [Nitrospirota bacterium]